MLSRRGSVQGWEEIGFIYRALNTASLWKLRAGKPISIVECAASIQHGKQKQKEDTNRAICKVAEHDTDGARRGLAGRRVTKPELLDQKCVITERICGLLRARERRDRVSLVGIAVVRLWGGFYSRDGAHARCFRLE